MVQSSAARVVVPIGVKRAVRPIDLVHLAKQCLGDEHLEYEVLRLFDTTVKTYFARLARAEDTSEIKLNLHSIKGAASGVGAWTIADLAKTAEAELQAGEPISAETVADLGHAIAEAGQFIAIMLSNEPA